MKGTGAGTSSLYRKRITLVYSLVSVLVMAAIVLLGPVQEMVQLALVTLLVIFLGLPHGALDAELASALGLTRTRMGGAGFFLGYLVLALCGIALWLFWPAFTLALFLLISAYHFSDDWLAAVGRPASLAIGSMVLGLPALSHPEIVARVFTWLLVSTAQANMLVALLRFAAGTGLLLLVFFLILKRWRNWPLLLEIGTLIAGSIVLPPLLYFVIYFCLVHAQRHVVDCAAFLNLSLLQCYRKSMVMLLLTLILAGSSFVFFASGEASQNMARWLFIGLFALTIPHMAIITYWNRSALPPPG